MTCGNKKRILFVMQSLYDGGAEKLLVDMLNNFDYSKYDIDLLLEPVSYTHLTLPTTPYV